uniref:Uncharacterized protein n=1 Tax=Dromaius novaehollandiae TaxID=8790 RepID=A0A8C4P7F5_DRONO
MSRLLKALADVMGSYQGSGRKGKKPEPFSRSEFRKLIQQEFAPAERVPASRYRCVSSLDADAEPMNQPERGPAERCSC